MATAEELLRGTSEGTVDKTLYVDFDTRTIVIPPSIHQLGVESDDDVKKLTFSVPRHYYDCDLSTFRIFINYMNAKKEGDVFEVVKNNLRVTEETIEFDWIVGRNALAYKGTAIFNVCMKKGSMQPDPEDETQEIFVVDQELNTTVAKLPVLEGLETGEAVAVEYADILMQWEEALFGIEDSAKQNIILKGSEVAETVNAAIVQKGSEVAETVNAAGEEQKRQIVLKGNEVVSTLDGTVSTKVAEYIAAHSDELKGPKGDAFTYEDFTPEQLAELEGDPGKNGVSPTISTSKTGKVTTITITDVNGTHAVTINDGADGSGAGDMLAATYDTNGDGVVDSAEDSNKLGGKAANQYALKTDIPQVPTYTMSATDDGNGNVTLSIGG